MKGITKNEIALFNYLSDIYDRSETIFLSELIKLKRYTQQSFLNWAEFKGFETMAKTTKSISNFKLI